MNSIDLGSILFSDGIALLIVLFTALGCYLKLRNKSTENYLVLSMLLLTAVSSIIDGLCYLLDTGNGVVNASGFTTFFIYAGNAIMALTNICLLSCWNLLVTYRMNGKIDKVRLGIQLAFLALGVVLLIINIFVPDFMFNVKDSIYERGLTGYYIISGIYAIITIDGIITYILGKIHGGLLTLFPIWLFIIPVIIGYAIDLMLPSISSRWAGFALGINILLMALQSETIYRDKLTGLFNREYLDLLKEIMARIGKESKYTAMMLDLNGFKLINDTYGHNEGDNALKKTGELLKEAIGSYGAVIRFAGDEFVIILNTQVDAIVRESVLCIERSFGSYNNLKLVPYQLSISVGYAKADLKNNTIDDIMKDIDAKMYEAKAKQHLEHPEWERKQK